MSVSPGRPSTGAVPKPAAHTDVSPPNEQQTKREAGLGLSPAQVVGSALGAVSAAVASSYFGVAGTLIGAALVSIVATVGSAAYTRSLRATTEVMRRQQARLDPLAATRPVRTSAAGDATGKATADGRMPAPQQETAEHAPARTDAEPEDEPQTQLLSTQAIQQAIADAGDTSASTAAVNPAHDTDIEDTHVITQDEEPTDPTDPSWIQRIREGMQGLPWTKVLVTAAAVLVVAMGTVTLIEAITGKPISASVGGSDRDGTTIGWGSDNDSDDETPENDRRDPDPDPGPSSEAPEPTSPESDNGPERTPTAPETDPSGPSAPPTAEPSAPPTAEPTPSAPPAATPAP